MCTASGSVETSRGTMMRLADPLMFAPRYSMCPARCQAGPSGPSALGLNGQHRGQVFGRSRCGSFEAEAITAPDTASTTPAAGTPLGTGRSRSPAATRRARSDPPFRLDRKMALTFEKRRDRKSPHCKHSSVYGKLQAAALRGSPSRGGESRRMSSVAKVFQVLEAVVSHQARGLAYSEVVAETRLPKATAHRLLKSLASLGYLRFEAEAGRYFGDLKLSALGSAVTSHFDLKRYVRPYLLRLQADTAHTSNLGVLSGDAGVYLDKVESTKAFGIKLYSEIGKRFPLHCTAMGKVLLAGMPPAERRKLVARRLESFTPHTITSPVALDRELR
ncbi:MAG: IclR family transcriptional regulator, partial [Zetaproteobacteria bacterium]